MIWGGSLISLPSDIGLECYCNAGKFNKALDVFGEINRCGWLNSHVLSVLVLSLMKVDKLI